MPKPQYAKAPLVADDTWSFCPTTARVAWAKFTTTIDARTGAGSGYPVLSFSG
jgi:hypothetical protein